MLHCLSHSILVIDVQFRCKVVNHLHSLVSGMLNQHNWSSVHPFKLRGVRLRDEDLMLWYFIVKTSTTTNTTHHIPNLFRHLILILSAANQ